jgi:hypothetical protein
MERVQKTLEFLVENECPAKLRTAIVQWTRFQSDHILASSTQKQVLSNLPLNLQKALVRHLYYNQVSRVPIFNFIENLGVDAEDFLNHLFLSFEYKTYTPGDVLVAFHDPPDRLIFIVR